MSPQDQGKSNFQTVIEISNNEKSNVADSDLARSSTATILCFNLNQYSTTFQFCVLSLGVFLFYGLYGIFMESLFRQPELKSHGWYLTLVQFVIYTAISRFEMILQKEERKIPLKTYLLLALITLTTMGFSNASLEYLNYPTQVIFKSCKLIPVLIGGMLIQKKIYKPLDFFAAFVMCIGLIIFMLADNKVSPNFHLAGVVMISCALVADAAIGNIQEKTMKNFSAKNSEVIFYSYGIGSVYLVIFLTLSGTLMPGIKAFASVNPIQSYGGALVFSATGYFGIQIVLNLVRSFGAFAAVTVTSLRKGFSIVLSFILFSKPFTLQYLVGGLIVLFGVYLNLASKKYSDLTFEKILAKLKSFQVTFGSKYLTKYTES